MSVAERVAQERCEEIGQTAGYSVRFESVLPRHYGSILYCTVGTSQLVYSLYSSGSAHCRECGWSLCCAVMVIMQLLFFTTD